MDISQVIAGWQTKLLQLDRRNSLLYFKGQRGAVGVVGIRPDELLACGMFRRKAGVTLRPESEPAGSGRH